MPADASIILDTDQFRCLLTFAKHNVHYLVVGGVAVRFYDHLRDTKDLDVLVANDRVNAERTCDALNEIIGVDHPNLVPEQLAARKRQITISEWGPKFEVLTAADGVNFYEAYDRCARANIAGLEVRVIGKQDLLRMKQLAARPQDLADVEALQGV